VFALRVVKGKIVVNDALRDARRHVCLGFTEAAGVASMNPIAHPGTPSGHRGKERGSVNRPVPSNGLGPVKVGCMFGWQKRDKADP